MQYYLFFAIITIIELFLFFLLLRFFRRLKQSETLLGELQNSQARLLAKLELNASLESELMQSFRERQSELAKLDTQLAERAAALKALVEQAGELSRSPQLLRELIISGNRKGYTLGQLAKSSGLSVDEVELILAQAGS